MKILFLYNNDCALKLMGYLQNKGHEVIRFSEPLELDWVQKQCFELAISYTYRFIVKEDIIKALNDNIINLHTSFLPWNRGASPNLWSVIENTPRGVTLHYINKQLDKGKIIAQRLVPFEVGATLKTSYEQLDNEAFSLFVSAFAYYPYWRQMAYFPEFKGTYHNMAQTKEVMQTLPGWDVAIEDMKKWGGASEHE